MFVCMYVYIHLCVYNSNLGAILSLIAVGHHFHMKPRSALLGDVESCQVEYISRSHLNKILDAKRVKQPSWSMFADAIFFCLF